MDGSNGGSNSPAPFLLKTYEMVDDPSTNLVVSWSHTGHSFIVWNPLEFARDLLPKYFKHNNFSSFIRQLNTYGFRKVDPDQWEFANEEFILGQRHLLKNIHRRKPIHSHSSPSTALPFTDSEREEFEKEIEKLKQEKLSLQTEVQRYKHENRGYEHKLRSLGQTLQTIDQRQHHLVSNLAHLLQNPQSESPNKKRRLLALNYLKYEANLRENMMVSQTSSLPLLDLKQVEKLDTSLTFWEKFLHGIDQTPSESILDFNMPLLRNEESLDSDFNIPPCTPDCLMQESPSEDCLSSLELDTLPISSIDIDPNSKHKPSVVDMNTSPAKSPNLGSAKDQEENGPFQSVPPNDVFWQQFLTEAPASSTLQGVEQEKRDLYNKMDSSRFGDEHKPWWLVDCLSLTQVERT